MKIYKVVPVVNGKIIYEVGNYFLNIEDAEMFIDYLEDNELEQNVDTFEIITITIHTFADIVAAINGHKKYLNIHKHNIN